MEFKNEAVEQITTWLEENRAEFTARRAGATWRNIALGVADAFKEDRPAIYDVLLGDKKRHGPIVPTGGATITRLTPATATVKTSGCKDCPDSGTVLSTGKEPRAVVLSKVNTGEPGEPETNGPDFVDYEAGGDGSTGEPAFTSAEDILERFDADSDMMIGYAKDNGIDVGRATKPETLAERIYNHYEGI